MLSNLLLHPLTPCKMTVFNPRSACPPDDVESTRSLSHFRVIAWDWTRISESLESLAPA